MPAMIFLLLVAALIALDRGPKAALLRIIRSAFPRVDYTALYPGKIVKQSADYLRVDVVMDDRDKFGDGLANIRLHLGLPDSQAQLDLSQTCRCLVGWWAANPRYPYACLFEQGELVSRLLLHPSGAKDAARKDDPVGHGTIAFTFGAGTGGASLAIVYTPGDGSAAQNLAAGSGTLTLKEKIQAGSAKVGIGG